jgi:hypothetical protein
VLLVMSIVLSEVHISNHVLNLVLLVSVSVKTGLHLLGLDLIAAQDPPDLPSLAG